jgi:tripartite-type tricarboxylate transporter receptor subunit TctC
MRLFTAASFSVALLAAAPVSSTWADNYPSKPIRLIVPAGAGSPPDIRARWLAEKLRPVVKQPIMVDNRPGAAGMNGITDSYDVDQCA